MIYDVIILGLGGMGSAAAASCARRGLRVAGVERFTPVHAFGSSHGRTRLIRQAYFEHEAYVPLLLETYDLWRALEAQTGKELLRVTGLLLAGHANSEIVARTCASARTHDLAVDELDARQMRRRFPMLSPLDDEIAVYEPLGGVVFPERTVETMLNLAREAGADLRFGCAFERIDLGKTDVLVVLDDGSELRARTVVSAMGAWTPAHPDLVDAPIRVQRNVQAWFTPESDAFASPGCPAYLVDRTGFPAPLYGMPDLGDGVKAAFHGYGATTHADDLDRTIDKRDVAPIQSALNAWMPGAGYALRDASACMYALTPDENFVVGTHPKDARVVVLGGFSGHGFKFVPLVGEIAADLVQHGSTARDVAFLSPQRFL